MKNVPIRRYTPDEWNALHRNHRFTDNLRVAQDSEASHKSSDSADQELIDSDEPVKNQFCCSAACCSSCFILPCAWPGRGQLKPM